MDTDNSVGIAQGRGVGGEGGSQGINGDGPRLALGGRAQYSVQLMCCRIVHLKPV